jgi:hypothetical protein
MEELVRRTATRPHRRSPARRGRRRRARRPRQAWSEPGRRHRTRSQRPNPDPLTLQVSANRGDNPASPRPVPPGRRRSRLSGNRVVSSPEDSAVPGAVDSRRPVLKMSVIARVRKGRTRMVYIGRRANYGAGDIERSIGASAMLRVVPRLLGRRDRPAVLLAGDGTVIPAVSPLLETVTAERRARHVAFAHRGTRRELRSVRWPVC